MTPTPPGTPLDSTNPSASSSFPFHENTPPSFQGQSNHFTAPINVAPMNEARVAGPAVPVFSPWIPPTGVEAKTCYSKYSAKANKKSDPVKTSILALSQALIGKHEEETKEEAKRDSQEREEKERKKEREETEKQKKEDENAIDRSVRAFANMVAEELLKMPEHVIANRKGRISAILFEPVP